MRGRTECDEPLRPTERTALGGMTVDVRLPRLGTNGAGVGEDRAVFGVPARFLVDPVRSMPSNVAVLTDFGWSDNPTTSSEVSLPLSENILARLLGILGGTPIATPGFPQGGEMERADTAEEQPPRGLTVLREGRPRGCCVKVPPRGAWKLSFAHSYVELSSEEYSEWEYPLWPCVSRRCAEWLVSPSGVSESSTSYCTVSPAERSKRVLGLNLKRSMAYVMPS